MSLEKGQIKKVFSDAEAAQHEWNVLTLLQLRGVLAGKCAVSAILSRPLAA